MTRTLPIAVAIFALSSSAWADELPGRYTIERVNEGILRLDSATGSISLCAAKEKVWSCATIEDDTEALRVENDKLKARIAELEAASKTLSLPSDKDVGRVMDFLGRMLDRLIRMTRELEKNGNAI